jgi:hypothetical protein
MTAMLTERLSNSPGATETETRADSAFQICSYQTNFYQCLPSLQFSMLLIYAMTTTVPCLPTLTPQSASPSVSETSSTSGPSEAV